MILSAFCLSQTALYNDKDNDACTNVCLCPFLACKAKSMCFYSILNTMLIWEVVKVPSPLWVSDTPSSPVMQNCC